MCNLIQYLDSKQKRTTAEIARQTGLGIQVVTSQLVLAEMAGQVREGPTGSWILLEAKNE